MADDRAQTDRDRHRLVVVEQERRHRRPADQSVAADRAHRRLDRVAEVAQPVDVAADRPPADLEARGELAARPVARVLEQGQQLQQPRRGVAHIGESYSISRTITDLDAAAMMP